MENEKFAVDFGDIYSLYRKGSHKELIEKVQKIYERHAHDSPCIEMGKVSRFAMLSAFVLMNREGEDFRKKAAWQSTAWLWKSRARNHFSLTHSLNGLALLLVSDAAGVRHIKIPETIRNAISIIDEAIALIKKQSDDNSVKGLERNFCMRVCYEHRGHWLFHIREYPEALESYRRARDYASLIHTEGGDSRDALKSHLGVLNAEYALLEGFAEKIGITDTLEDIIERASRQGDEDLVNIGKRNLEAMREERPAHELETYEIL